MKVGQLKRALSSMPDDTDLYMMIKEYCHCNGYTVDPHTVEQIRINNGSVELRGEGTVSLEGMCSCGE